MSVACAEERPSGPPGGPADAGSVRDASVARDAGVVDRDAGSSVALPGPHPGLLDAVRFGAIQIPSGNRIGECLAVEASGLRLVPCDRATAFTWSPDDRRLHADSGCLGGGGQLDCDGAPQWVLDDALRWNALVDGARVCLRVTLDTAPCDDAPEQLWGVEPAHESVPFDRLVPPNEVGGVVTPDGELEPLFVFGAQARVLVGGDDLSFVAAGTAGASRLLAVGGFRPLSNDSGDDAWEALLSRGLAWLARDAASPVVAYWPRRRAAVEAMGYAGTALPEITEGSLDGVDLLVLDGSGYPERLEAESAVVRAYVERGGSVLVLMRNWLYWLTTQHSPDEFLAARVAAWAGIGVADATGDPNTTPALLSASSARDHTATAMVEAAARSVLGLAPSLGDELVRTARRHAFAIGKTKMHATSRYALAKQALDRVRGPIEIGPTAHHV